MAARSRRRNRASAGRSRSSGNPSLLEAGCSTMASQRCVAASTGPGLLALLSRGRGPGILRRRGQHEAVPKPLDEAPRIDLPRLLALELVNEAEYLADVAVCDLLDQAVDCQVRDPRCATRGILAFRRGDRHPGTQMREVGHCWPTFQNGLRCPPSRASAENQSEHAWSISSELIWLSGLTGSGGPAAGALTAGKT